MPNHQVGVLHGLTKVSAAEAAGQTDGQLLRRFAADRDDGAFAALIQRHGPLVYGVCRNVLRHEQDAEDAFQATFLVLARRAGAIREGLALGGWLYRVAYRVATKSRLAADRRRRRETQVSHPEEERPVGDLAWRELQAMLDEELNRLPEKYRAPFVLCVLTGKSKPEAAAELGWKEGTVSSRLAHARERLRVRLARRGVALSAVLSGLAIAANGVVTAVPAALVATTRQLAVAFAMGQAMAGVPAVLARAVLRGMTLARLRHLAIALTLVGVVATAAVAARPWEPVAEQPPPPPPEYVAEPAPAPVPVGQPDPNRPLAPMIVLGTVAKAEGQQVPDARVTIGVVPNPAHRDVLHAASFRLAPLGDGRVGPQGAFQVAVPQTSPARHRGLTYIAKAPGHAFTSRRLPSKSLAESTIRIGKPLVLTPGGPARARLVDPAGKPARRVTVHVLGLEHPDQATYVSLLYYEPPVPLPDWPGPLVTDDDGVFAVPDVVPGTVVTCQPRDDRFAPQWLRFVAREQPPALKLTPARELTGRILADDTRKPLADALVVVETPAAADGGFTGYVEARTDADGRYAVKPFPGPAVKVTVYPPAGAPYPVFARDVTWPPGADTHDADLSLPRGVLVRGTVEEAGSGRRVVGAAVNYTWADRHKVGAVRPAGELSVRGTVTGADGTFTLAVPTGSGHVVVKAADLDYVPVETPGAFLRGYGKGGRPVFPDAVAPLTVAAGAGPQDLTLRLRRGASLRGRVLGADGKPVHFAVLHAVHYRPHGIEVGAHGLPVRRGRFELPGCEPGAQVPVWVYDADGRQAGYAVLPADPAVEAEIRLVPTVTARVTFVDPAKKPMPKAYVITSVLFRPGAEERESALTGARGMIAVSAQRVHDDPDVHAPDDQGGFVLRGLIPGATYHLTAYAATGARGQHTFTAPPAGTQDLGQVPLQPPRAGGIRVGQTYFYQPVAEDPDGDPVALSLVEGPAGMSMDPETGALVWVPSQDQVGVHKVRIRASDPFGGTAYQEFPLRIAPALPPVKPLQSKDRP